MKYLYFLLFAVSVVIAGCVDDYTDSNPPDQLEAPFVMLSATDPNIDLVVSMPLNKYTAYVKYGAPVEINVNVIKSPGKISAASVSSSIEEYGTVEIDETSFNAVKGQNSGSFKIIFKPSTILSGTADRSLNLEVTVTDDQLDYKGEEAPLTTTITFPLTLVAGPCVSSQIVVGTYRVTSATGIADGGDSYDAALLDENSEGAFSGNQVVVAITKNRPGVYTFSEVSGGVAPISGWTRPNVRVNLCGSTFTGRAGFLTFGTLLDNNDDGDIDDFDDDGIPDNDGRRTYTVDGTVNADGTITVNWSYVGVDFDTPADPAHGSYTLTRIP